MSAYLIHKHIHLDRLIAQYKFMTLFLHYLKQVLHFLTIYVTICNYIGQLLLIIKVHTSNYSY